jgi:hypothetical protein
MNRLFDFPIIAGFFLAASLAAQPAFEVLSLEGSAKVQRASKQKWDKLDVGSKINENDIVETYFQTKLTLRFGEANTAILGSNSKALFSMAKKDGADKNNAEAAISLFGGGLYTTLTSRMYTSVFSTNAVAEFDSGSCAVIVDAKSGETGVLVLGGKTMVRNIAQQKSKELSVGNTTIILPGREPSPPLYMTFRHVAVLKHFFGDNYIADQMQSSSIIPSDDRGGTNRVMLSEGVSQEAPRADAQFYKRLFDINKIYGSILGDRERDNLRYHAIHEPSPFDTHAGSISFLGGAGLTEGLRSAQFYLVPRYRYSFVEAAFRFSIARNYRSQTMIDFNSLPGILDKIQCVTAGNARNSTFLSVGSIDGLTLGKGLVVDRFRNTDDNRIFHPLGVTGKAEIRDILSVTGYLADVTDPTIGGVHLALEPSLYYFGFGFYFDRDQYHSSGSSNDIRYARRTRSNEIVPQISSNVGIYELGLGAMVTENYEMSAQLLCEFAQKRDNGRNDGFMIRAPALYFSLPRWSARGGLLFESGRILAHEFNAFYCSRRSFYRDDTLYTANTALWNRRNIASIFAGFGANPFRGVDVSADITHNVKARNTYAYWGIVDSTTDTNRVSPRDFSLDFRCAVNSVLTRPIRYGEVYFRQMNGRLFPPGGTYFSSWNSEAGFSLVTTPLRYDLSFEFGGRLFYLDRDAIPNDVIDDADRIYELFAGIRWEFL